MSVGPAPDEGSTEQGSGQVNVPLLGGTFGTRDPPCTRPVPVADDFDRNNKTEDRTSPFSTRNLGGSGVGRRVVTENDLSTGGNGEARR